MQCIHQCTIILLCTLTLQLTGVGMQCSTIQPASCIVRLTLSRPPGMQCVTLLTRAGMQWVHLRQSGSGWTQHHCTST
jgi:hypothetical protein